MKSSPILEREIRDELIDRLVHKLNFPKQLILLEKRLDHLPFIGGVKKGFTRRLDVLCLTQDLLPLLLIECKLHKITSKALDQVLGYNYYIKAPYIACVSKESEALFRIMGGGVEPLGSLISYEELCRSLNS